MIYRKNKNSFLILNNEKMHRRKKKKRVFIFIRSNIMMTKENKCEDNMDTNINIFPSIILITKQAT